MIGNAESSESGEAQVQTSREKVVFGCRLSNSPLISEVCKSSVASDFGRSLLL